ncbi:GNAT family N-acetyltransferase [Acidaminobacter sp. JC074]|uniref:GNAT family N-acetyltransferase n=1 Tax=Acidaminobacter sp. JC074 TaxID=2530199 RepID=UPI001F0E910E|nr:GNAT family N-acetyltransferase [Acidaminobacter sp. JC074]MCH4886196.1 GNAT family N-acetyltransferase [Acidaminobacter sp. JC074]
MKYQSYYHKYLGYDGSEMAFSEQRDKPLNRSYYYRVIATQIDGKDFYSVSSNLRSFDVKDTIKESFEHMRDKYEYRCFYRMGLESYKRTQVNLSRVYTYDDLDKFDSQKRAHVIQSYKDILDQGRRFVVTVSGENVAYGMISDIDFGGGNIVVYVKPEHRNKGYAKMLVSSCVDWCLDHDILPVYLVDKDNLPSIRLAKSLGFASFSTEHVLSE